MAVIDHRIAVGLGAALAGGYLLSRFLNYHPLPVREEECRNNSNAPSLSPGQPIKVVTYNTQFFAGTDYHFFYDGGADALVDRVDVRRTVTGVSAFLAKENPDFILLQEVDCGARRTGYLNQVELLRNSLPDDLRNSVATLYWKSKFVPHPRVMGSAGTKLVVFSRYRLEKSTRYQLPRTPGNPIVADFNFKRALLEVEIPLADGRTFCLLNTHLEAFPKGTDVMRRQVDHVLLKLDALDKKNVPWILGGDFNLLPPGQWKRLNAEERGCHHEPSEIFAIYERYRGVPTISDASGERMQDFLTFTKRIKEQRVPIRTLDYFFASQDVRINRYAVRQAGVKSLSDHLPLVAEFTLAD
jgi:endonuclease/exonuclease/phosphatase family metal-dependent hydrolase